MDSNAVIDYLGKKFTLLGMEFMSEVVDSVPFVSTITKMESLAFLFPTPICGYWPTS